MIDISRIEFPKGVPTARNCRLNSIGLFGCDLSEELLINLAKLLTSRLTVDADRPKWRAIDRNERRMPSIENLLSVRESKRLLATATIRWTNATGWRNH
jgi:hypothetical protein